MNDTIRTLVQSPMVREIYAKIVENRKKLEDCKGTSHNFVRVDDPARPGSPFKKWQCTHCGGTVSATDGNWYRKGFEHGVNSAVEAQQAENKQDEDAQVRES